MMALDLLHPVLSSKFSHIAVAVHGRHLPQMPIGTVVHGNCLPCAATHETLLNITEVRSRDNILSLVIITINIWAEQRIGFVSLYSTQCPDTYISNAIYRCGDLPQISIAQRRVSLLLLYYRKRSPALVTSPPLSQPPIVCSCAAVMFYSHLWRHCLCFLFT